MMIFGPVPSRRLGRSLGINNIPPKHCTYGCVYCQLGRTGKMIVERRNFYSPEDIIKETAESIKKASKAGESIDYLTLVSDGEPTLDINLGRLINDLKSFNVKTAVITNSSLLYRDDVKKDLMHADWVSVKVDSIQEEIWRKINRPHKFFKIQDILKGLLEFAKEYQGKLVTETMIVQDLNENLDNMQRIAEFIAQLSPSVSYLSIPTRPPAEKWVKQPQEQVLNRIYQIFNSKLKNAELLIGYEGNAFAFTGNIEKDILSITAVHPMREDAVREFLKKAEADWQTVENLINKNLLIESEYNGRKFYSRRLIAPHNKTDLQIRME